MADGVPDSRAGTRVRDETDPRCTSKSNEPTIPACDELAGTCDVEWGTKTSAIARGADAEREGQSFETQSVRRRWWGKRRMSLCRRANREGDSQGEGSEGGGEGEGVSEWRSGGDGGR